jgi:hypothetical protein
MELYRHFLICRHDAYLINHRTRFAFTICLIVAVIIIIIMLEIKD